MTTHSKADFNMIRSHCNLFSCTCDTLGLQDTQLYHSKATQGLHRGLSTLYMADIKHKSESDHIQKHLDYTAVTASNNNRQKEEFRDVTMALLNGAMRTASFWTPPRQRRCTGPWTHMSSTRRRWLFFHRRLGCFDVSSKMFHQSVVDMVKYVGSEVGRSLREIHAT